jgi:hypothetical protein
MTGAFHGLTGKRDSTTFEAYTYIEPTGTVPSLKLEASNVVVDPWSRPGW